MPQSGALGTVLIADDDRVALAMLRMLLGQMGYRLEFAETGAAAVERARVVRPDLLLLDVNMPDMNGFDVCRTLRADPALAEVPIIMLTALSDREARLQGLEAGADDFISKPFDRMELKARVGTVMRLNRYRRVQDANRMERQLEMASAIQQQLLPKCTPTIAGLEIATRYRSATEVGGDLYDFIVRDGQLYFVVADVSGHGVASAIFMSGARSALRTLLDAHSDLAVVAERLNAQMVEDSGESGMFVTALVGQYTPATREIVLLNCGHPDAVIGRRDGSLETVTPTACPLGLMEPLGASAYRTTLGVGDRICLYTDGLTEAVSATREQFGAARLQAAFDSAAKCGPEAVAARVSDAVASFRGRMDLDDDLTLLVMQGVPMPRELTLTVTCTMHELGRIALELRQISEPALGSAAAAQLDLAVTEVCSNIVRHGHPSNPAHVYHVIARASADAVEVEIRDRGPAFAPGAMTMPSVDVAFDDLPEGGFGLALIAETMDEVEFRRDGDVNVTRLVKRRP